jgi:casein kinase II subunit beta
VPKVYGFKIYGRKGSKYEQTQEKKEVSYYTPDQIKNIKTRNNKDKRSDDR